MSNGYALFLRERAWATNYKGDHSFNALQGKFDHEWNQLTWEAKDNYKERARDAKRTGIPVQFGKPNLVKERKAREQQAANAMVESIHREVALRSEEDTLEEMSFCILDVTTWVSHVVKDVVYALPAEVGLVEVSLQDGIRDTFHALVHHGDIPRGARADMQQKVDKNHKIPIEYEELRQDFGKVYSEVLDFVAGRPIYVMPDRRQDVQQARKWLAQKAPGEARKFVVYSLPELVFAIAREFGGDELCPCESSARRVLEGVAFSYSPGVSCEQFHAKMDTSNEACALGRAKSLAYLLLDHLCTTIPLPMFKKTHYPFVVDSSSESDDDEETSGNWKEEKPSLGARAKPKRVLGIGFGKCS